MQHDPFLWEVGEDDFIYMSELSAKSKYVNKTLNKWLSEISDDKRKQFIEALFDILESTKSETITDIAANWKTNLPIILDAIKNMDPQEKILVVELFKQLAILSIKNMSSNDKNYIVLQKRDINEI